MWLRRPRVAIRGFFFCGVSGMGPRLRPPHGGRRQGRGYVAPSSASGVHDKSCPYLVKPRAARGLDPVCQIARHDPPWRRGLVPERVRPGPCRSD